MLEKYVIIIYNRYDLHFSLQTSTNAMIVHVIPLPVTASILMAATNASAELRVTIGMEILSIG